MTAEEDAWDRLHQTPRTAHDARQSVQAAALLLPPTLTLQAAGQAVTFRHAERRYRADIATFLDAAAPEAPLMFCLCSHGGFLRHRQRWAGADVQPTRAALTRALKQEWAAPAHDLIRALMSVVFYAKLCEPLEEDDEGRDERVAHLSRQLNSRLCALAATRVDGVAGSIATTLAATWPGSPHDLVETAKLIAASTDPVPSAQ